MDDDKEKLKEQLAILNEAFTLTETEEEEEGKALVPSRYISMCTDMEFLRNVVLL